MEALGPSGWSYSQPLDGKILGGAARIAADFDFKPEIVAARNVVQEISFRRSILELDYQRIVSG